MERSKADVWMASRSIKKLKCEACTAAAGVDVYVDTDEETGLHASYGLDRDGRTVMYLYNRCEFAYGPGARGKRTAIVHGDFPMYLPDGQYVLIEDGFEFDGASIPPMFWRLFQPFDTRRIIAAALHDKLYEVLQMGRLKADLQIYCLLIAEGNSKLLAWTYWKAVDIGGRKPWDKHRDKHADELEIHIDPREDLIIDDGAMQK